MTNRTTIYFWEEEPGVQSWARLQSFITLVYTFWISWVQIRHTGEVQVELISLLLIAAVAPKTIQKFAEGKKSTAS